MIIGEHSVIRTTDSDDAYVLHEVYSSEKPRAFLLNAKREISIPTFEELRHVLGKGRKKSGQLVYTIEDKEGVVKGIAYLGVSPAAEAMAELTMAFIDDDDFSGPIAEESFKFFFKLAFETKQLRKLVAHCLSSETALRTALVENGFQSEGIQREAVFTLGRYYDIEALGLIVTQTPYAPPPQAIHKEK